MQTDVDDGGRESKATDEMRSMESSIVDGSTECLIQAVRKVWAKDDAARLADQTGWRHHMPADMIHSF